MTGVEEAGPVRPGGRLDGTDQSTLDALRGTWEAADPMPVGLLDRVRFALSVDDLHAEVGRITTMVGSDLVGAGARGAELARSITFDGASLAVAISVSPAGESEVRVDGWIAPAGSYHAELRVHGEKLRTTSDEYGRFAFARVGRGAVQLLVSEAAGARALITPAVVV
jgi:hypothetical protein